MGSDWAYQRRWQQQQSPQTVCGTPTGRRIENNSCKQMGKMICLVEAFVAIPDVEERKAATRRRVRVLSAVAAVLGHCRPRDVRTGGVHL